MIDRPFSNDYQISSKIAGNLPFDSSMEYPPFFFIRLLLFQEACNRPDTGGSANLKGWGHLKMESSLNVSSELPQPFMCTTAGFRFR